MSPDSAGREETWHEARLIPVAGIRGQDEQERRATSALLAVMRAVPDFGRALLDEVRAPRGQIRTYAEVQLRDGDGKLSIPDGTIVVERGARRWSALVEVKTGTATLANEQVGRYLEMARDHGFDALVTISNEITPSAEHLPVALDRRRTRRVAAYHLSWWRIMTTAILQHRHRGISDPDQAWILGELIAYLDHEKSGASGFQDMGPSWVKVRDAARQGTLRATDKAVGEIADRWMQFMDYVALGLSQDLGTEVTPLRPRRQSAAERHAALVEMLASEGSLAGGARVQNAVAPVEVRADLRARQVTTSVTLDAPREGRPLSRVNWLLRQLRDAPDALRVEVSFANTRETTSLLLAEAREYPQRLLSAADAKREPRTFNVALAQPMGQKSGKARGSFVGDTRRQMIDFYGEIVQNLKPWRAKAPQLPDAPQEVPTTPQPEPPPFAAAADDGSREIGEGITPREDAGSS
jgi:hypothetical protein